MRVDFLDLFKGSVLIWVITAILFLVVVLVIVIIFEKKLARDVTRKRSVERMRLERKIVALRKSKASPEKLFARIDKSARDFLGKRHKISRDTDYSEIMEIFARKNDKQLEDFSQSMLKAVYSGKKIDKGMIKILLNELEDIAVSHGKELHIKNNKAARKIK